MPQAAWRPIALAASLFGMPADVMSQIVPTPGTGAQVTQTQNGLPQVDIAKPSGAGVSVNTYNQFDVQRAGAILNNSPTIVNTQQAGMIDGNPNFGPGQSARIIVNQVNSNAPSQLRGFVEVAGNRAEVVLANSAGIHVDGGGFINTSRATLTTGQPHYGADGSLAGFHVDRGLITVQGAGLNASNVDQVDLVSRAVQANAAIYAKNLNVVTGANRVDHDTLAAKAIQGDGVAPGVSIDVSQLGGMYADSIHLVGTESGVGVSNAGVLAAQAGDLTLQANGRLVLTGKTMASGNLALSAAGGIDNSGTTYSLQSASVNTAADLTNSGTLAAQRNLDVNAGRVNSTGTLGAGVNDDGSIGRIGDLSVTTAGLLTATGENVAGGNVTLTGDSVNLAGGRTLARRDLVLNVANVLDNSNGALSAANNATLNGPGAAFVNQAGSIRANGALVLNAASIDNTNGKIGNDAGGGGSVALTTGALANQGGAIGSDQDLSLTAGSLSGDGSIVAGRNGTISLVGDYTQTVGNILHANGDLSFTTSGKLTNQGKLDANGALTVNAANVDNQAGAGLNSANTTVNANGGTIDNAGRIEGDTVTTNSDTLNNVATIIGREVTLNAGVISNSGPAAVIAAANRAHLYASSRLSNTGGAGIFSVGDIDIAANGQRDADGFLANRTGTVLNDRSSIEALGSIELAAQTFTNTRPAPAVSTETTDTTTKHETKRGKYMACATMNAATSSCTQSVWEDGYKAPRNDTFGRSQIVSQSDGANATDRVLVLNVNGQQRTVYYNTLTDNGNGTITVNYWDAYDPHVNYVPDTEYVTRSDAHKGYQRVEVARDTTTTIQQDKVTSQAPQAQFVAGGHIVMKNVGTINNEYSAIAAGGSIRIGDADAPGGAGTGGYGGTTVNNVGQTLYQHRRDDIMSTYAWNVDINRDRGQVVQPSVVYAPVAIGNTGGTIVANQSINIEAKDVNNRDVAAENSSIGATGGTSGSNHANAGVIGNGLLDAGSVSGLYRIHPAPDQPYLIVTDPRLTSYTNFISSDYMLGRLGLNPASIEKRLGDGMYEQQMVRNQVTQLTGRTFLPGYANAEDEYRALMTSGANYAKQFGLVPGMALSAAQMDALTSDIVWLVNQTVTLPGGGTTQVLAPVVYLANAHASDLRLSGALIAADDVEMNATGSTTNSGAIKGGTKTVVTASDILNRGGTIASSGENGLTVVSAANDVVNASGRMTGNRVAAIAGRDIVNTTLVDTGGVSGAAGASKVSQSLIGRQGTIAATGDLSVQAGRDLSIHGANLSAGGDALVTAGRDIHVDTVQSKTDQSLYLNDQHHWEESTTTHVTSGIGAGGSLAMRSGNDTVLKGATVTAGKDLAAVAGGNLTATTVTDEHRLNNVAVDDRTRREVDRTYDQHVVGTSFMAGRDAALGAVNATDMTKGNVTLTGSSVISGTNSSTLGGVTIGASRDVAVNEAREEHHSYRNVRVKRGSVVSGSVTKESSDTRANVGVASTVSGDTVQIQAGRDVGIQGSNVVGTNDVTLAAGGNIDVTTSQDRIDSASRYERSESGLLSGGGLAVTIGTRSMEQRDQSRTVTNHASVVGSSQGSVSIEAGQDATVTGSQVVAGRDIGIAGRNVVVNAATDTYDDRFSQHMKQSGLTVGLGGGLVGLGQAMGSAVKAGTDSGDARLVAVQGVAAAEMAYQHKDVLKGAANAVSGGDLSGAAKGVQLQLSIGSSHSGSESTTSAAAAKGSSIIGNGSVTINATGSGQAGMGDLTMTGANVVGQHVALSANHDVTLQSARSTEQQSTRNRSAGFSAGVAIGVGGKGAGTSVFAGGGAASGHGNGSSVTNTNTTIAAGDTASIRSGNDTTLTGAQASGKSVKVDVGRDLTMTSVQDTSDYANRQSSVSGGLTYAFGAGGGLSGNVSTSRTRIDSTFASVNQQTGLVAGAGGFDVNVGRHTQLNGAEIASAAPADKNTLTTDTLGFSDIQNHFDSSGSTAGIGLSGATAGVAGNPKASLMGGPTGAETSDHARGTTHAAVSAATLTVKSDRQTGQDSTAGLSRDTANANQTVRNTFDLQKAQNDLALQQAFGRTATYAVAQIADQLEKNNPAFAEGGAARDAMHAAVAAIGAAISGGNVGAAVAGSIAGDVLQSVARPIIEQAVGSVPADQQDALRNALNVAVTTAGGSLGGAVAGGSSGTVAGMGAASNNELYNRQLHDGEKKAIAEKAGKDKAEQEKLTRAACYAVKCWAEYPEGSAERNKNFVSEVEAAHLGPQLDWVNQQKEAGLFEYTPWQKVGDALKNDPVGVAKDTAKVVVGGVTAKTGVGFCATGLGCTVGGWMAGFGLSEVVEGGSGLYNRYNGVNAPGDNPLRWGFNQLNPTWGNAMYDGVNFAFSVAALKIHVPLNVGVADGLNRPVSIFGVTVPRIDNVNLLPFIKQPWPYGVTQGTLLLGVGSKGAVVVNDVRQAVGEKK